MRTPRLPVVDWTDTPADINGLFFFAERPNLVSARVPSRFKRAVPTAETGRVTSVSTVIQLRAGRPAAISI